MAPRIVANELLDRAQRRADRALAALTRMSPAKRARVLLSQWWRDQWGGEPPPTPRPRKRLGAAPLPPPVAPPAAEPPYELDEEDNIAVRAPLTTTLRATPPRTSRTQRHIAPAPVAAPTPPTTAVGRTRAKVRAKMAEEVHEMAEATHKRLDTVIHGGTEAAWYDTTYDPYVALDPKTIVHNRKTLQRLEAFLGLPKVLSPKRMKAHYTGLVAPGSSHGRRLKLFTQTYALNEAGSAGRWRVELSGLLDDAIDRSTYSQLQRPKNLAQKTGYSRSSTDVWREVVRRVVEEVGRGAPKRFGWF